MTPLKSDVTDLKSETDLVKTKILKMDMIIDNELRVNIQRAAWDILICPEICMTPWNPAANLKC